MALARCAEHGAERVQRAEHPLRRDGRKARKVGQGYEPCSYPNGGIVCPLCDRPALIWLNDDERYEYFSGRRIFQFAGGDIRVRLE